MLNSCELTYYVSPSVGLHRSKGGGGGYFSTSYLDLLFFFLFPRRGEGRRSGTKMSGPTTFTRRQEDPNPKAATIFERQSFREVRLYTAEAESAGRFVPIGFAGYHLSQAGSMALS